MPDSRIRAALTTIEEQLAEQAQRFAEVLALNAVGSWNWDVASGEVVWSDMTYEIMGLKRADAALTYESATKQVHPEDREHYESALKECMEVTGAYSLRTRIVRPDGTIRYVIAHGRLHRGSDDQPVRVVGTLQDVTEEHEEAVRVREFEKDALSAQKRLEEQLRIMVEASPFALLLVDDEHRIQMLNPMTEKLFGYDRAELLGQPIELLVPREFHDDHKRHLAGYMKHPEERRMGEGRDLHGRRKDGSLVAVEISLSPVETGEGRRVLTTVTDITERKRAETKLRASEQRSRVWLENSPACTKIVSPDFKLQYMSSAGVAGLGIEDITQLYGQPYPLAFFPEPFQAGMTESLERAKETGEVVTQEAQAADTQGNTVWFHSTLVPVKDEKGNLDYILIVSVNTTERRQLEDELRQAQKMEAVGQLAAGVAHDFNNLLMGVQGCASVAASRLNAASPAVPFLDEIMRSVKSGASISRQLLMFSRKQDANPEVLDLNATVVSGQQMLLRLLDEDIELTVNICESDTHVLADEGKLEQILLNLAINARDAMHSGGRLAIETDTRFVEANSTSTKSLEPGPYVVLRVSDTGCGMSEETLSRIFDPFFTTKDVGAGTGLGLSTVFGIVKQAGGKITVHSKVNQGTTFEILLPHAESAGVSLSDEPIEEIATPTRTETVLLVEDEQAVRMTVRHYLTQAGFQILEAEDGATALEILRTHSGSIELLVTDMVMPGMNGVEFSQEARKIFPEIRTLFMSAHGEEWLRDQKQLEVGEFLLQKPFDQNSLAAKLEELLRRSPPLQPEQKSPSLSEAVAPTIFVVEDQAAARMAICETLRDEGYQVLEAADGAAAVQCARDHKGHIDVLLVDAILPKLMGVAVAADLRERNPELVVFLMSGYPEEIALPADLRGSVSHFVEKPIDLNALLLRIETAISRPVVRA